MKQNTLLSTHYTTPNLAIWSGREDGPRIHHLVKELDLLKQSTRKMGGFALLGFECDEGVVRNFGRTGAAQGPSAIRTFLTNLPLNEVTPVYDAGNVVCLNNDLENAQLALSEAVIRILDQNLFPVVLGGGHEIAFGHYDGIARARQTSRIGIINFDAHLDMRPLLAGNKGSSGTPFLQIAKECENKNRDFNYLCIGVQPLSNTQTILSNAKDYGATIVTANDLRVDSTGSQIRIAQFIDNVDSIYLTICLDAFSQSIAPGVSAPQPFGLMPDEVLPIIDFILQSKKLISFDVAELCPAFDQDNMTARLAAHLIGRVLQHDKLN